MRIRRHTPHLVPHSAFRVPRLQRGGMLVATVIFCALVTLVLSAYLSMLRSQHKFTYRSQVWNACMATCEAGIEEALSHINHSSVTGTNFALSGWVLSSGAYRKERFLNGGIIRMAINASNPPTITATALLRVPSQTNFITRVVQVRTKINQRFPYALLSKGTISMSGNTCVVDSYDSTDPLESTLGRYDPLKRTANATVATTATTGGAISIGNGDVYGKAGTGPGGTLSLNSGGVVGDMLWNSNPLNLGTIQPGAFTSDVNVAFQDPVIPNPFAPQGISGGTYGGTNYDAILTAGDYRVSSVNLSGGRIAITGNVRILVDGQTTLSGDSLIYLIPGASIEYYSGGDFSLSGKGLVNAAGLAENFNLYGLSTCKSITYGGQSSFVGTVYAPSADIKMSGSPQAYGAMVGKSVSLAGEMSFHYDEALRGNPRAGRFIVASWQEL